MISELSLTNKTLFTFMKEILDIFILVFHLFPASYYSEGTSIMLTLEKLQEHCFEVFARAKVVNMMIATASLTKLVRNSEY